jgi:hypothetical protein
VLKLEASIEELSMKVLFLTVTETEELRSLKPASSFPPLNNKISAAFVIDWKHHHQFILKSFVIAKQVITEFFELAILRCQYYPIQF